MVSDGIHYDTARPEKKDGVIVALTDKEYLITYEIQPG